ncbi:MAG: type II toxin-antitoxin system VapC family toxin, partial [Proteobacteria bacterium]|nr:type II toxin-antitoxin system VapC family toxin [Pseudomonadota bacterium]
MICVLDASAAIEVFLNRPGSKQLLDHLSTASLVVSPDLYCSEVSDVFWKLLRADQLSREDCESGIDTCLNLVDDLIPMSELSQEVFAAAIAYNMTAYDMYYAVTTRRYNGRLLTMDRKLKEAGKKKELRV